MSLEGTTQKTKKNKTTTPTQKTIKSTTETKPTTTRTTTKKTTPKTAKTTPLKTTKLTTLQNNFYPDSEVMANEDVYDPSDKEEEIGQNYQYQPPQVKK